MRVWHASKKRKGPSFYRREPPLAARKNKYKRVLLTLLIPWLEKSGFHVGGRECGSFVTCLYKSLDTCKLTSADQQGKQFAIRES